MVKVKDINSAQSDWAILEVTIPRDKTLVGSLLFRLLERLPILNKLRFFL